MSAFDPKWKSPFPIENHSALMPASLMIGPHFCKSAWRKAASSAGLDDVGGAPTTSNRSLKDECISASTPSRRRSSAPWTRRGRSAPLTNLVVRLKLGWVLQPISHLVVGVGNAEHRLPSWWITHLITSCARFLSAMAKCLDSSPSSVGLIVLFSVHNVPLTQHQDQFHDRTWLGHPLSYLPAQSLINSLGHMTWPSNQICLIFFSVVTNNVEKWQFSSFSP